MAHALVRTMPRLRVTRRHLVARLPQRLNQATGNRTSSHISSHNNHNNIWRGQRILAPRLICRTKASLWCLFFVFVWRDLTPSRHPAFSVFPTESGLVSFPPFFFQGTSKYTTLEDKKIAFIWLFLCTGSFSVMASALNFILRFPFQLSLLLERSGAAASWLHPTLWRGGNCGVPRLYP